MQDLKGLFWILHALYLCEWWFRYVVFGITNRWLYITEFASAGPKTYAIKTASGKYDISKSKGFSLHYRNQQVFNFDSLKEQAISKGLDHEIAKLQLHLNETIMRRKKFEINVEYNKGKVINMTYDKRFIVNPQCAFEDVTIVNTLPFGHIDLDMLSLEY